VSKRNGHGDAIKDVHIYLLPYVDLLSKHKYDILLVSDDDCFRGLVEDYSNRLGLKVGTAEVDALADMERLRSALRSIRRDSL